MRNSQTSSASDLGVEEQPQSPSTDSTCSFFSTSTRATSVEGKVMSGVSPDKAECGGAPRRPVGHFSRSINGQGASAEPAQTPESSTDGVSECQPRFDSLQELLERAGYKDTRVVTPQAKVLANAARSFSSSIGSTSSTAGDSRPQGHFASTGPAKCSPSDEGRRCPPLDNTTLPPLKSAKSSSGGVSKWISRLWRSDSDGTGHTASGQQQGRAAAAEPTSAHFPTVQCPDETGKSPSPRAQTPTDQPADWRSSLSRKVADGQGSPRGGRRIPNASSPDKDKIQFLYGNDAGVRTRSKVTLWKGSLAYRRSHQDLQASNVSAEPIKVLKTKGSLGHLRGGVGVGISSIDCNSTFPVFQKSGTPPLPRLLQQDASPTGTQTRAISASPPSPSHPASSSRGPSRKPRADGLDCQSARDPDDDVNAAIEAISSNENATSIEYRSHTTASANLFGAVAKPLMISEPAVAPRNADCFKGPETRGLRHAKSVEALRSALEAKRQKRPGMKTRHSVIGQQSASSRRDAVPPVPRLPSLPTDSSTLPQTSCSDPDLAAQLNDNVRTTYQADELLADGSGDASPAGVLSPERPAGPPVLTLTSPTGVHSPKFINLSGSEFEPRTLSPPVHGGRMLVHEGGVASGGGGGRPDGQTSVSRGRARRRSLSRRPARAPSADGSESVSSDGAESVASQASSPLSPSDRPRRTRRGCRAGRKHRSASREGQAAQRAGPSLEESGLESGIAGGANPRTHPEPCTTAILRRSTSARVVNRRGAAPDAQACTRSFGAAVKDLGDDDGLGEAEDDPFMAHVSAREKARAPSAPGQDRGIASILASRHGDEDADDGENVRPDVGAGGADGAPRLKQQRSNGSLRGRILGRATTASQAESARLGRTDGRPCPVGTQRTSMPSASTVVRQMSRPPPSHGRVASLDSPTKAVVARRRDAALTALRR
ncbi:unnamed protein product [Parajaminaea phylloscopi]